MRDAAARFAAAGRPDLVTWAETKIRDEQGHDVLALRDLRALGYDAAALVEAVVPPASAALVRYFERAIHGDDPVRCIGYAYALERLALCVDASYIAEVEACLPSGCLATRCIRVHSATGSDHVHVAETVEFVASLSGAERARIAAACYETARLCGAPSERDPEFPDTIEQQLRPFKTQRTNHAHH